ncbi:MAG: hypothetical protein ABFE01_02545 [Phycisphaerales bacterium]
MNRNRRTFIQCCAAGLLVLACGFAASPVFRSKPPSPDVTTPEKTAEFLASEAFAKMDSDEKREYVRRIQAPGSQTPVLTLMSDPSVSEEQRRRVMQNVLPVVGPLIDQRLDEFDRLPADQKTARLDAFIDQLQKSRKDNQGTMSSVERMNLMLQYVDPQTRAKMRKHIPALLTRMKERGIKGLNPWGLQ